MKYVIFRSQNDSMGKGIPRVHGHEVDPGIGQWGGFVLEEFRTRDPNYKDHATGRTLRRVVLREELQWEPVDCPGDKCPEEVHHPDVQCPVCKIVIPWKSRKWYICEPAERDAKRLAGIKTDWTYQEIHTDAELRFFRNEPEPAPVELPVPQAVVLPVDVAELLIGDRAAVLVADGNTYDESDLEPEPEPVSAISAYRELQAVVTELIARGEAPDGLSNGKASPKAELQAFIDKHGTKIDG